LTAVTKLRWRWPVLLCALVIALGVIVSLGIGRELDRTILKAVALREGAGNAALIEIARGITWAGDASQRSIVMVVFAGLLAWRRRFRAALVMLVAVPLAGVTSSILKELIARERPELVPHLDLVTSLSYPSGHAANAAAVLLLGALLLARKRKALWIGLAVVGAALVGLSRMALGVHYPSDVLGGWMLGTGFALIAAQIAAQLELPPKRAFDTGQDAADDDVHAARIGVDAVR
jgi:undecaprenyl-diphosphatase